MSDLETSQTRREELKQMYLKEAQPAAEPAWTDGVHHLALICSDTETTIRFYTEVLGMRLAKIVPNRDEPTSTHIFLDMGGGNMLAFFDFPSLGGDPAVRGIGSMHHVAIRTKLERYQAIQANLKSMQIPYSLEGTEAAGSVYFRDPDNILLEITHRPGEG